MLELLTIGEVPQIDGWVADGSHSMDEMKAAVCEHSGVALDVWPRHTLVEVTHARMECVGCGCAYGRKHSKGCDYDNDDGEGWVWNFRAGGQVTILMRDGRSVFDHFPQHDRAAE